VNEKEIENFGFSLMLVLFVFSGSVSFGNGKRVDVSGIIYHLIGINGNSSSTGNKITRELCISARLRNVCKVVLFGVATSEATR
jgi:hypothetical protein